MNAFSSEIGATPVPWWKNKAVFEAESAPHPVLGSR